MSMTRSVAPKLLSNPMDLLTSSFEPHPLIIRTLENVEAGVHTAPSDHNDEDGPHCSCGIVVGGHFSALCILCFQLCHFKCMVYDESVSISSICLLCWGEQTQKGEGAEFQQLKGTMRGNAGGEDWGRKDPFIFQHTEQMADAQRKRGPSATMSPSDDENSRSGTTGTTKRPRLHSASSSEELNGLAPIKPSTPIPAISSSDMGLLNNLDPLMNSRRQRADDSDSSLGEPTGEAASIRTAHLPHLYEQQTLRHDYSQQPSLSSNADATIDMISLPFINGVHVDEDADPLAGGSFADVYQGSYQGQEVAVKRFRIFCRGDESSKVYKRFYREASIWQNLRHPNILSFLGVDQDALSENGSLRMVSPWMAHGTLMEYLREVEDPEVGKDTTQTVNYKSLIQDTAAGLAYLHSQSYIHGDLHGSNVFIDEHKRALLGDFGLTAADILCEAAPTTTINKAGAVRWLSPELFAQEDGRAPRKTAEGDIFAFGRICLSVYARRVPYHKIVSEPRVLVQVLKHQHPTRPTLDECHGAELSDELWVFMLRCWSADPADRPRIEEVTKTILSDMIRF